MKILLLILSLPTENATARMRAWRALKACGAAVLRDGVYLLPQGAGRRAVLEAIAADVNGSGGQAFVLESASEEPAFPALFVRTAEFDRLSRDIAACAADAHSTAVPDLARLVRKLRKGFDALAAIDFFPGEAQRQVAGRLEELERALHARTSPDEPGPYALALVRLDGALYQGRVWATRRRPWVDRLASAWLISRFIDRQARFLWLATPADCPAEALGFDFDGAAFSHSADYVTFETLLHSFGLEGNPALARLARLVHFLDVGGLPVAEAPGIETVLAGMRDSLADDDALLEAACRTFDYLHANYLNGASQSE